MRSFNFTKKRIKSIAIEPNVFSCVVESESESKNPRMILLATVIRHR